VDEPLRLEHVAKHNHETATNEPPAGRGPTPTTEHDATKQLTCECEETCTEDQLNSDTGGYSCKSRIEWLISAFGKSEVAACRQVGGNEFASECASCDPDRCAPPPPPKVKSAEEMSIDKVCAPCSQDVCQSDLNLCPRSLLAPFLCLSGGNSGGCSQTAWTVACTECCRLTEECFAS
jgi:hypothetical protein